MIPFFRVWPGKARRPAGRSGETSPASPGGSRVARPHEAGLAWIAGHPELGEAGAAIAELLDTPGSRRRRPATPE
jgi:hypothetical protein